MWQEASAGATILQCTQCGDLSACSLPQGSFYTLDTLYASSDICASFHTKSSCGVATSWEDFSISCLYFVQLSDLNHPEVSRLCSAPLQASSK